MEEKFCKHIEPVLRLYKEALPLNNKKDNPIKNE
jgi:hypothetical protein